MRTVRCSARHWGVSAHGLCLPVGVSVRGRVCSGGCLPRGGVCQGGVCQPPPAWTEWQTRVKTLPCCNCNKEVPPSQCALVVTRLLQGEWIPFIVAVIAVDSYSPHGTYIVNRVVEGYVFTGLCLTIGRGMHGGGMCGGGAYVARGACMAGGHVWWGHVWKGGVHGGGHMWQGACVAGGMHGRGACVVGGMHGRGGGAAWQKSWPLQRAVRILLGCILFSKEITSSVKLHCNGRTSCLLAKVPNILLVSKQFFQVEHSIIGQILKSKLYWFRW